MSGLGGGTFVLTNADLANALPIPAAAELVAVYVNLGTAGSTASTVQVNKNGSAVSGALVTLAAAATKGNKTVTNPYVGVNAAAGAWTDQPVGGVVAPYPNSTGGVNNVAALGTYAAGDTVSLSTALGTSAANPGIVLVFNTL
jgi:hypothetical protein